VRWRLETTCGGCGRVVLSILSFSCGSRGGRISWPARGRAPQPPRCGEEDRPWVAAQGVGVSSAWPPRRSGCSAAGGWWRRVGNALHACPCHPPLPERCVLFKHVGRAGSASTLGGAKATGGALSGDPGGKARPPPSSICCTP
jgi:hypothetical protein